MDIEDTTSLQVFKTTVQYRIERRRGGGKEAIIWLSSQIKKLITRNLFFIVQRATAQSKTGICCYYGVADDSPGFSSRLVFWYLALSDLKANVHSYEDKEKAKNLSSDASDHLVQLAIFLLKEQPVRWCYATNRSY
jgi:hypothetical protein